MAIVNHAEVLAPTQSADELLMFTDTEHRSLWRTIRPGPYLSGTENRPWFVQKAELREKGWANIPIVLWDVWLSPADADLLRLDAALLRFSFPAFPNMSQERISDISDFLCRELTLRFGRVSNGSGIHSA